MQRGVASNRVDRVRGARDTSVRVRGVKFRGVTMWGVRVRGKN